MSDKPEPSTLRREKVVEAATDVFRRYGYGRTTMADIAQAAKISRPTLYATFSDKAGIFESVIEGMVATELVGIRRGLSHRHDLASRLRYACRTWASAGFELVQANPDAKDLFDDQFAAVRAGNAAFENLLVELLAEPVSKADVEVTAPRLAEVIGYGMQGFKRFARTSAELHRMIDTLVTTVCAALS
ncbi:Transcriptional regulator, TetR family [Labilithrix luteola]|uniref:Transcriptional regulator, TetR family n=1 Tax=Labilithrix luteola TaxID=1391654 RepID=A0A0K1QET4_9BACT|nr:TetR/AcrR family transcriptional regulator [Labilithrix luteola]AKV04269.1 Transcriptional regulator, TetR family [Labilithrix luteola]